MPQVQVEMTMDESRAWAGIQRMVRGTTDMEDATRKVTKATAEHRKEAGELERALKKVFEETRTPAEKHAQQMETLKKLYAANKIDAETYGRAVATSMQTMEAAIEKTTQASKKLSDQTKETQRVQEELGREGQRIWEATRTPLEQYEQEVSKLANLYRNGKIDVETYYRAAEKADQSYREAMGETEKKVHGLGDAHKEAVGGRAVEMVRTLAEAFGVGMGLAGAIELARREYENYAEAQRKAIDATKEVANPQLLAYQMAGVTTDTERKELDERVEQISKKTGIKSADIYRRVGNAASARGSLSVDTAMQAVELSAQYTPDQQSGTAVAGAILDFMKTAGIKDPKAALGFLQSTAEAARVPGAEGVAKSAAPAVSAIMMHGGTAQEAAGFWAATTQGSVDIRGRRSMTGAIRADEQIAKALPEKDLYEFKADEVAKAQLEAEKAAAKEDIHRQALNDPAYLAKKDAIEAKKLDILSSPEYQARYNKLKNEEKHLKGPAAAGRKRVIQEELHDLEAHVREQLESEGHGALAETERRLEASPEYGAKLAGFQQRETSLPKVKTLLRKGTGLKSLAERLAYMHAHPEVEEQVEAEMSFEAGTEGPLKQIMRGKGAAYDAYAKNTSGGMITPPERAAADIDKRMKTWKGGDIQNTAGLDRTLDSAVEAMATADQKQAKFGSIRKHLVEALQQSGESKLAQDLDTLDADTSGDYGGVVQRKLQGRAEALRHGHDTTTSKSLGPGAWGSDVEMHHADATPAELAKAEALERMAAAIAESMREINEAAKTMHTAADKQLDAAGKNTSPQGQLDRARAEGPLVRQGVDR